MKKIAAILLSLSVVFSVISFPEISFAAEQTPELAASPKQLELLERLGLVNVEYQNKYPHSVMLRGSAAYDFVKFAPMVQNALAAESYDAIYRDVTSEHRYYTSIKALTDAGLMNGYPDGSFRPDGNITPKEAAKVFLNIIGYKEYIAVLGIDKAINVSGVLDGINSDEVLTNNEFARMMWNTLHAPAIEMTMVYSDGGWYGLDEDYLGIYKLYGITVGKGIVDGVPQSGLQIPDQSLDEDEIRIDGERFVVEPGADAGDIKEYLGYGVDFYIKKGSDDVGRIIYISKSDKNEEMVLKSDEIEKFSDFTYGYWKNNKSKKISLPDSVDIIYNGIASPMCSDEAMVPEFGTVTLISNDGKSGYEVVKVESYEFLLVDNVDVKNHVFYDIDGVRKLDLSGSDEYKIFWDGAEYPIERIIYGDFLVVKRTPQGSEYDYAEIEVRKDRRSVAKIEKFSIANGTLRAGGVDYVLWSGLSDESQEALVNGAVVSLYFSTDGTVVRIEKGTAGGMVYGYLINAAQDDAAFDKKAFFRIVDANASVDSYGMGKVLKIDGSSYKEFEDISSVLKTSASMYPEPYYNAKFPYAQVVRYELSEDGLVKGFDTIIFDSDKEEYETALRLDKAGTYRIRNMNASFYDEETYNLVATLSTSTYKLQVPLNIKDNEENYSVFTWADNEVLKNNLVFNIDDRLKIAEAAYNFEEISSAARVNYKVRPVIVKEKIVELGDDSDMMYKLICYEQSNEVTYTIGEEDAAKVDVGDMIRVELNADKSVKEGRIELVFDASVGKLAEGPYTEGDRKYFKFNDTNRKPYNAGYKAFHLLPLDTKDGILGVTTSVPSDGDDFNPEDENKIDNINVAPGIYYKYSDVRGNVSVEPATLSDITTYYVNPYAPTELVVTVYANYVNYVYIIDKEN